MDNPFSDSPQKTDTPAPTEAPEAPVEGTENPFENSNKETPATPTPPVVQMSAPTEALVEQKEEKIPEEGEVVDESGNELLIENDGNVFWIFQKVAWSFLKMALVVGVIGLLIWIIWRPSNNPLNKIHNPINVEESVKRETKKVVPEKKKESQKKVEKVKASKSKKVKEKLDEKVPTVSALAENYAYKTSLWADWMENMRQAQNAQILSRSLYWAKRAEGFFDLTTADLLSSEDTVVRAKNIDGTLLKLRGLLEESKGIVMTLDSEQNRASAQSRASEAGMLEADRQLSLSIEVFDGDKAELLLAEKSRLYQDFVTQNAKVTAYYYTLNRVQSLIPMLQGIHDNILANRQVLIDNVQVVGFPQDRFHRILTPAEWKQMR